MRLLASSVPAYAARLAADGIACLLLVALIVADGLPTDPAPALLEARSQLDDAIADALAATHTGRPGRQPGPIFAAPPTRTACDRGPADGLLSADDGYARRPRGVNRRCLLRVHRSLWTVVSVASGLRAAAAEGMGAPCARCGTALDEGDPGPPRIGLVAVVDWRRARHLGVVVHESVRSVHLLAAGRNAAEMPLGAFDAAAVNVPGPRSPARPGGCGRRSPPRQRAAWPLAAWCRGGILKLPRRLRTGWRPRASARGGPRRATPSHSAYRRSSAGLASRCSRPAGIRPGRPPPRPTHPVCSAGWSGCRSTATRRGSAWCWHAPPT